jgi:DNA-binding NtrC family response regulator
MLFGDVAQAFETAGGEALVPLGLSRTLLALPLRDARDQLVGSFERWFLGEKLNAAGGNISRAAESVGVSRQFFHRLMAQHGMKSPRS